MISPEHAKLMANYNKWQNDKLYDVCAGLDSNTLHKDMGAFFGSVFSTLNHILYGDIAFMSRFTGEPADVPPMGVDLFSNFRELQLARQTMDDRLLGWADSLTEDWLAGNLTYISKVDGREITKARWMLVTHLFNHQTHHRGQASTLLSQLGKDIGSTDIPFMPAEYSSAL